MPRGLARLTACLAAGAALALCLPKPGLCFLGWIAPAALFYNLRRVRSASASAALAGAFGFAFCAVVLHWIYQTCRFAGVPLPVALLAWGVLSGFLALSWALYGALAFRLFRRLPEAALLWALAALWTALESASARWTPRLPADLLGYTQWRYLSLLQPSSVFGPHALGFLLMAWGAALASGRRRSIAAAGALALAWGLGGAWVLAARKPAVPGASVEILQPNIDQYQKWDENSAGAIKADFEALLAPRADGDLGLVVWPESALPGWLEDPGLSGWAAGLARRAGAPMLVGAISAAEGHNHNSAALFDASGKVAGRYDKRRLVPFGEFVPLRRWLQPWIGILAQMGDFDAGAAEQTLLDTPLGKAGVTICYEAAFPDLSRRDAGRGARVLVNLTNDGWYKDTWGPYQHFQLNTFRAVENRALVVRAANTGISGIIDPYGRVLARTELGRRRRLDARVPADAFPRGSFYSRHGDWFGTLCLFAAGACFLLAGRKIS